jgi:hypothetical protein
VRCAACGHRWTAYPADRPLDLVSSPEEGAIAKEAPAPEPEAAPLTGDDLPRVFRGRAEEGRRNRKAAMTGVVWTLAALALAVVIGLAIVFREGVVRGWPQTASLYAGIGLPVNITGLVIEQVHAEPSLQDGHATLAVSGVLRNVTDHPVIAPPLRISLFNEQGKRVAGLIATLGNARVPPGETRHFVASIFDPPQSEASLQVEFALGASDAIHATPASVIQPSAPPAPPAFTLRGPADANATAPTNAPAPAANSTVSAPAAATNAVNPQ